MPKTESDSELLREGCKSYHQAAFAVAEFRRQMQGLIRRVVEQRANDLAEATKLDKQLFLNELKEFANPRESDGTYGSVGVTLPRKSTDWSLTVYFYAEDPPPDYAVPAFFAQVWIKRDGPLFDRLRDSNAGVTFEHKRSAWITEPILVDENFDLDNTLDTLLGRWITLWRDIGGLKQYLTDS